jgi:hypothetical protein
LVNRSPGARRAVLIAFAFLLACDPVIRVKGIVHDQNGTPLDEVTVTLNVEGRPSYTASTAKDGSFHIGMVGAKPERTNLTFQKRGYRTIQERVRSARTSGLDITLVGDDSPRR